jgi:prepilin-type N-terminal cleavage/methylation domain-containing protein
MEPRNACHRSWSGESHGLNFQLGPVPRRAIRQFGSSTGFSLVELLAVVAIVALIAALSFGGTSGFLSPAGRRGAVNMLLGAFEQARVAALESGQTVYVGFADLDFPVASMRYASFLIFRETSDDERAAGLGSYFILQRWTPLPRNVAFMKVKESLIPPAGGQSFPGLNAVVPGSQRDETFPSLAFNGSGAIEGATNPIELFLFEGYYAGERAVRTRKGTELFEKISFSRYSGRAQLDVTPASVQ